MAILWRLVTIVATIATFAFSVQAAEFIGGGGTSEMAPIDPPEEQSFYGAIALGLSTGLTGSSQDFTTSRRAENAAFQDCPANDCSIVATVRNACAALAVSENYYGIGKGHSKHEAKQNAIGYCDSKCQIIELICSDN